MKIVWNDILKEKADVLVTPASRNGRVGIGLDRFVHQAAGPQLLAARKMLGRIAPGEVGVTAAFGVEKLTGAKWIIHALGPMLGKGSDLREDLILDGCYLRILLKAVELGAKTVALPVLSSGKFGADNSMARALDIAVKAIDDFTAAFPGVEVKLVGVDEDFYAMAKKKYPARTVAVFDASASRAYRSRAGIRHDDPSSLEDAFVFGDENDVLGVQLVDRLAGDGTFRDMFHRLWEFTLKREKVAKRKAKGGAFDGEYMTGRKELALRSGISASTIKRFCSNASEAMHTTKDKIIALSIAMRLPVEITRRFLSTCGYSLGDSRRDKKIAAFVQKRSGTVDELNWELTLAKLAPLMLNDKSG